MHGKASKAVRAAALVLLAATIVSACGRQAGSTTSTTETTTATTIAPHIPDRNIKIGIQRDPAPQAIFEVLDAFPTLEAPDEFSTYDLRWRDISAIDLQPHAELLWQSDFDSNTVWPQTLPEGFDPALILENGKNPGLDVRALHERGIDGRGISIGIIDLTLLTTHEEYSDRLMHYEEIPMSNDTAGMHGAAVTSLALGKTCGVAPAAKLYYIGSKLTEADTPRVITYEYYAKSIHRLLDINLQLPDDEKIRVISISRGFLLSDKGYREVMQAIERAKQEGVFVVSTSMEWEYRFRFSGLARDPKGVPDDVSSYNFSGWTKQTFLAMSPQALATYTFFPMDNRTFAGKNSNDGYEYSPQGGYSWVMPYVSGLYALCCQVKPAITPDEFWQAVTETAYEQQVQNGTVVQTIHIVNPTELVAKIEGR